MKIGLKCPAGHTVIYEDYRFNIPDSQKTKWWLGRGIHCMSCDMLLTEAYELLEVVAE